MIKKELVLSLYEKEMLKFGNYVLKSGQASPVYVNLREVIAYPQMLQSIADCMWTHVPHDFKPALICGVPYSALTLATHLSIKHKLPMVLRRKEAKTYGTKQKLEGVFKAGQECLIIEDVVTSGQSILETAIDLKEAGLIVKHVVCFVDREQGGSENLKAHGISLHAVTRLAEMLNILCEAGKISTHDKDHMLSVLNKEKPNL